MKLSTKGRYGLRAVADLATHAQGQPVPLASIARRQHLSVGYLEGMFGALRRSGIVRSVKGIGGGYLLAHAASEITVGDILRALEGDLSIVDEDILAKPGSLRACVQQQVWDVVTHRLRALVNGLTLADLIEEKQTGEYTSHADQNT